MMQVSSFRWCDYVKRRFADLKLEVDDEICDEIIPPSTETLNKAWIFICGLLAPQAATPSVMPSGDGGVQFHWHKNGWSVVIEIPALGEVLVWTNNRLSGDGYYGNFDEYRDKLLDILRTISEDKLNNSPAVPSN
jgi:hypothetical protein